MKRLLTLLALAGAALALAATAFAADHTTVTETENIHGAFTAPEFDVNPWTDTNNVTYTGHFTAWGNFNLNERNTNNTVTLTFRAPGSDRSSLIVHETAHFATNADGQVTVSFDRLSLDCD
jgi:hypothetical protein